jgi:hypothetical protein
MYLNTLYVIYKLSLKKKTAHAITLLLRTQMKKKLYRKRNDSKNTTNLSEHIIFSKVATIPLGVPRVDRLKIM